MKLDLEWLQNNKQYILLSMISGSHAYGTAIEGVSDMDERGCFILPQDQLYGLEKVTQINDDDNDIVYYELGRFCELLLKSNPTVLELLNPPSDCIRILNPLFKEYFIDNRKQFLTKACNKTFLSYAQQQISKATGLNKKMNWEKQKVEKKDLLDFCYVLEGEKSIPWKKWNGDKEYDVKFIGAVNIEHARDTYALYYDAIAYNCFNDNDSQEEKEKCKKLLKETGRLFGFGYKGLVKIGVKEEEKENYGISNQLRLSDIPKGEKPFCTISYNKEGYSESCKDYREYQEWLNNRNTQRYVDVDNHGQQIDGKNMLHCVRLIETARDIVDKRDIIVRRDNKEELLDIRRGKVDLPNLIIKADNLLKEIEVKFKESDLKEDVDKDYINSLLKSLRITFYSDIKNYCPNCGYYYTYDIGYNNMECGSCHNNWSK